MPSISPRTGLACLIATSGLVACLAADVGSPVTKPHLWRQHDIRRPKPPVAEPAEAGVASKPPSDAVVLFDGSNLDAWSSMGGEPAGWKVVDGALETIPGAGKIRTKREFGDIQLHVEWAAPRNPQGAGQNRGNSGVFLMDQFEIQVLDSYQADTYADGQAGAIYGQYPPLFNASKPPGEWQTYDIAFRRPRFDASGKVKQPALITVLHNGLLIQNNEAAFGPTSWLRWLPYADKGGRGPIALQDHDHPVRYRNLWLREMPERPEPTETDLARPQVVTLPEATLEAYAGRYRQAEKPDAAPVKIAREGGHLTIAFPFLPRPLAIEPISETEFDMPHTDGHFRFLKDAAGRVSGVHFKIGDGEREMARIAE